MTRSTTRYAVSCGCSRAAHRSQIPQAASKLSRCSELILPPPGRIGSEVCCLSRSALWIYRFRLEACNGQVYCGGSSSFFPAEHLAAQSQPKLGTLENKIPSATQEDRALQKFQMSPQIRRNPHSGLGCLKSRQPSNDAECTASRTSSLKATGVCRTTGCAMPFFRRIHD